MSPMIGGVSSELTASEMGEIGALGTRPCHPGSERRLFSPDSVATDRLDCPTRTAAGALFDAVKTSLGRAEFGGRPSSLHLWLVAFVAFPSEDTMLISTQCWSRCSHR